MNRRRLAVVVCVCSLGTTPALVARQGAQPPASAAAASAKTWLEHPEAIEAHLRTADVTSIEDIGTGVTHPRRAHLRPSQPVESLVWKVLPPGRRGGF